VHLSRFYPSTHPTKWRPTRVPCKTYTSLGTLSKSRLSSHIMTPINLTIFCRPPPSPEPPYVECQITFRRLSVLSVSFSRNEPGPLGNGFLRPHAPPGGTPHPTHEGTYSQAPVLHWVQPGISVYDASQQLSMDPSPCSGYIQLYSVQSTNEPYPLGFRPERSPGPMPGAWPPSEGPADVQNASESWGPHL
jgi:hypothetical protein